MLYCKFQNTYPARQLAMYQRLQPTAVSKTIYSVSLSFTCQTSHCFMYVWQMHGHPPNIPRILKEWSCISMRLMKLFMAKSARHCVSLTISASSCDGSVVLSAFTISMASLAPAKVGNKIWKLQMDHKAKNHLFSNAPIFSILKGGLQGTMHCVTFTLWPKLLPASSNDI